MCGTSNAHTSDPQQSLTNLNNNNIFAVATALQSANPSVVPVIAVNGLNLGTAPGAASATAVGNGAGIVGLFNSAASRAGGLLEKARYAGHADLYRAHFETLAQLNRAANRTTTRHRIVGYVWTVPVPFNVFSGRR